MQNASFTILVLWNELNLRSKLKKTIRETPISCPGWIPTIVINFTRVALDSLSKWLNIDEYWLVFMLHCGRPLVRTLTLKPAILILWPSVSRSGRYVTVPHSGPQPQLALPSDCTVHNQPLVRHQSNLDGVFNELRNNTQTDYYIAGTP